MISLYRKERQRTRLLSNYHTIVVGSHHMEREYRQHVPNPEQVEVIHLPFHSETTTSKSDIQDRLDSFDSDRPIQLLFAGRIETNKGSQLAARAAQRIAITLNRNVCLTFVGEGSDLASLELNATKFAPARVEFVGWRSASELDSLYRRSDLLLFPSIWPEPFGLVGLEAASRGVPAVGFAHGGTVDWLKNDKTGMLAKTDPPTVDGLVHAAVACLESKDLLTRLSFSAFDFAKRWPSHEEHFFKLTNELKKAISVAC